MQDLGVVAPAERVADRVYGGCLGPLALRLYPVPVSWVAATNKLGAMNATISGSAIPTSDWTCRSPAFMAWLAVGAKLLGSTA